MPLYHYCSVQTAISILTSKTVRLSSLTHSNDSMEGQWSLQVIEGMLAAMELSREAIEITMLGLKLQQNKYDALGLCLSEEGDLLSQWRGYAHDGTGFSIGFSDETVDWWKRGRTFRGVIYDESEQRNSLRPYVERLAQAVKDGVFQGGEDVRSGALGEPQPANEREERRGLAAVSYARTAADMFELQFSLKNPAFSEEREWRLITFKERTYDACEFHASGIRIVPYLDFKLTGGPDRSISEIILGPKNTNPVETVTGMIESLGYKDVKVRRSRASYR